MTQIAEKEIQPLFAEAETCRQHQKYDQAIDICCQGLEKNPEALYGRLLLGRCYWEKGMHREAKEELEKVARVVEKCLPVYQVLSEVYAKENDIEQGMEALRRSLYFSQAATEGAPKVTPLEMNLVHQKAAPPLAPAALQSRGIPPEGERKTGENKGGIQTDTLAEIYLRQGHRDKAIAVYEEILARDPENTTARQKCESLRRQGQEARVRLKILKSLEGWLAVVEKTRQDAVQG